MDTCTAGMRTRHYKERRKAFKKKCIQFILLTLLFIFLLTALGIGIIFYSPYTYLKELYVATAMTTMNHQYLARIFVKEDEINRIMEKNKVIEPKENTDQTAIRPEENKGEKDMELIEIRRSSFKGYLLCVKDPSRVSIGTSKHLGKKGMRVEDIVKEYGAVAGLNAGAFQDDNGHGTGGLPLGILLENGSLLHTDASEKHHLIGFDKNNVLVVGDYSMENINTLGIRDAISFRPFLIVNGKPVINKGNGGWGVQPRSAIGQRKDGTVLLLAIDGRQPLVSLGATLKDVQDILLEYGAYNAANLDGGSSTTLIYENKLVNSPSSKYGARYVPSAFIVK